MAEDVKVTNWPTDQGSGSRERVALDLAKIINDGEHGYGKPSPEDPRAYWLKLYSDCVRTVTSRTIPPK